MIFCGPKVPPKNGLIEIVIGFTYLKLNWVQGMYVLCVEDCTIPIKKGKQMCVPDKSLNLNFYFLGGNFPLFSEISHIFLHS